MTADGRWPTSASTGSWLKAPKLKSRERSEHGYPPRYELTLDRCFECGAARGRSSNAFVHPHGHRHGGHGDCNGDHHASGTSRGSLNPSGDDDDPVADFGPFEYRFGIVPQLTNTSA